MKENLGKPVSLILTLEQAKSLYVDLLRLSELEGESVNPEVIKILEVAIWEGS